MSDAEMEAAVDRCATELARRLGPIVTIQDVQGFAVQFISDMWAEGYLRPQVKSTPVWKQAVQQAATEPNEEWKAARAALQDARGGSDGA